MHQFGANPCNTFYFRFFNRPLGFKPNTTKPFGTLGLPPKEGILQAGSSLLLGHSLTRRHTVERSNLRLAPKGA